MGALCSTDKKGRIEDGSGSPNAVRPSADSALNNAHNPHSTGAPSHSTIDFSSEGNPAVTREAVGEAAISSTALKASQRMPAVAHAALRPARTQLLKPHAPLAVNEEEESSSGDTDDQSDSGDEDMQHFTAALQHVARAVALARGGKGGHLHRLQTTHSAPLLPVPARVPKPRNHSADMGEIQPDDGTPPPASSTSTVSFSTSPTPPRLSEPKQQQMDRAPSSSSSSGAAAIPRSPPLSPAIAGVPRSPPPLPGRSPRQPSPRQGSHLGPHAGMSPTQSESLQPSPSDAPPHHSARPVPPPISLAPLPAHTKAEPLTPTLAPAHSMWAPSSPAQLAGPALASGGGDAQPQPGGAAAAAAAAADAADAEAAEAAAEAAAGAALSAAEAAADGVAAAAAAAAAVTSAADLTFLSPFASPGPLLAPALLDFTPSSAHEATLLASAHPSSEAAPQVLSPRGLADPPAAAAAAATAAYSRSNSLLQPAPSGSSDALPNPRRSLGESSDASSSHRQPSRTPSMPLAAPVPSGLPSPGSPSVSQPLPTPLLAQPQPPPVPLSVSPQGSATRLPSPAPSAESPSLPQLMTRLASRRVLATNVSLKFERSSSSVVSASTAPRLPASLDTDGGGPLLASRSSGGAAPATLLEAAGLAPSVEAQASLAALAAAEDLTSPALLKRMPTVGRRAMVAVGGVE